jgi:hypothetical protein
MRNLVLVLVLLVAVTVNAQWNDGEYVDEFGDGTGETYQYQLVVGVFSNSATTNSECQYVMRIPDGEPMLLIDIYPYGNSSKENFIESTYQQGKLKSPTGVVTEHKVFVSKKGSFYFSKNNFDRWQEATLDAGEYTFACTVKSTYSESSYRFKFKL